MYKLWIEALQQGIGAAIQHSDQRSTSQSTGNNQAIDSDTLNNCLSNTSNKIKKSK